MSFPLETRAAVSKETPLSASPARGLPRRPGPLATPEILARARRLERELGRPLRDEIDGPLNDEELEEILIARMISGEESIPVDDLLKKYGRQQNSCHRGIF